MKDALQLLLRRRRSELRPEDHGFTRLSPQGRRPAGNGLSQAQVDEILGFGRGTYERLEAGRYTNAPEHVLKAVGLLFKLNNHEWTWLWRMTWRRDPPFLLRGERDEEIPAAWVRLINDTPHPVYITNYRYDLIAYNRAFTDIFHGRTVPENTLEWMLLHPDARHILRDWSASWAPFIAPHVWAARAAHPDDEYLADLEQRIIEDPDAGPIYKDFGPIFVHPDGACRPFDHPLLGIGWVTLVTSLPMSSSAFITMSMMFDPGEDRPTPQPPLRAHPGT